jgi:uncharacterized cupin superfamily protein
MSKSSDSLSDRFVRDAAKGLYRVFDAGMRYAVRSDLVYKYHRDVVNRVSRSFVPQFQSRVTTDDWKYLIVLDACRYDAFEQCADLEGHLQKANSCSGWTKEWAMRNFSEGDWSDTMYISGSAWVGQTEEWLGGEAFYSVEEVWNYGWDDEKGGVPPEGVRKATQNAIAEEPDRRAIIHFQQPHTPLMGEQSLYRDEVEGDRSVYEAMRRGKVSKSDVWEAYVSNLELVLEEVRQLLEVLDGRIVITADHGECFGEYNLFEHPGALVPPIIEVPWHVIEKDRDIDIAEFESGEETDRSDAIEPDEREEVREERLKQLGYLE